MATIKIRDFDPNQDGPFLLPMPSVEALGATRAIVQIDDGSTCQGYVSLDGQTLWAGPLVNKSAARAAADAAAAAAHAAAQTTETNRAQAVVAALALLDAGTATATQVQTILAAVIRFVNAQNQRNT